MGLATLSRRLFHLMRPLKTTRQRRLVSLNVRTLEPRIVLNGDVGFVGGEVVLDNFSGPGAAPGVEITETTHNFGGGAEAAYKFTLQDLGKWNPQGKINLDGAGGDDAEAVNNTLFVSKDFLDNIATGLQIDDTNNVNPDVTFGAVDFSDVDTVTLKGVADVTQTDKLQTADLAISAADVTLTEADNDFQGSVTITAGGEVELTDDNTLTLGAVSGVTKLTVDATLIELGGNIVTKSSQTFNGDVTLTTNVVTKLTNDDNGTITFAGDVLGDGFNLEVASVGNFSAGTMDMSKGAVRGTLTIGYDVDNDTANTAAVGQITSGALTIDAGGDFNDGLALSGAIDATGAVNITDAETLTINSPITTNGKDVTITVGDDLFFGVNGDISTSGGKVSLTADKNADANGAIDMANGAKVDAGTGNIQLSAAEDITIGGLRTTGAGATVTITSSKGSVIDDGGADTDIDAASGTVTIDAFGDIGDLNGVNAFTGSIGGTKAIHTIANKLDLASGGEIVVSNNGATTLIGLNAKNAGAGTVFISATGNLTVDATATAEIDATDKVSLLSNATLTLPAAGLAAADIRFEGNDIAGVVSLNAARVIFRSNQAETVQIIQNNSQVDAFAGGGLTINADKSMTVSDFTGDGVGASANVNQNITITAGTVALGTLTVGADVVATGTGDILLTAKNGGSVIVSSEVAADTGDITLIADGNVEIDDPVTSTGGTVTITADKDLNGGGGVWIKAGGEVSAGKTISITGSDVTGTADLDSIRIENDGTNDQVVAVDDIILAASAAAPAGADIIIAGRVHSTGNDTGVAATSTFGDIIITSKDTILAESKITADLGNVTFNSPVQLTGDLTVTASGAALDPVQAGNVTFTKTIDGAAALTVDADGTTTFAGKVGDTTALTSLTTTGGGVTNINGGVIETTGNQTYEENVILGADTTITAGGAVEFQGTVQGATDGNESLVVAAAGLTTFGGAVGGGGKRLESLTTNGGDTTAINGGTVTTSLFQDYGDDVILGADTTLTAGTNVTFGATLKGKTDGNESLIVNAPGTTTFGGAVGSGSKRLESLTTDGGVATNINGGSINTKSSQSYGEAVVLGADATLTAGAAVTFSSTVRGNTDGGESLLVTAAGATTFAGAVGDGGKRLENLTTNGGNITNINGGSVDTKFFQNYADDVVLGADTTLTAGTDVTFGATLKGKTDGGESLLVNADGVTKFQGAVGGDAQRLESLETSALGSTQINGGAITTVGKQTFRDDVSVGGSNATLTTTNSDVLFAKTTVLGKNLTISAGAGSVTFTGTVDDDGNAATASNLSVTGTGTTTFTSQVGNTDALTSVTTAGPTIINGGVVATTEDQSYGGKVTLGAALTTLTAGKGATTGGITFEATVDGAAADTVDLVLNADEATTFNDAVGSLQRLKSLQTDADSSTNINGGLVNTLNSQTYLDDVVIGTQAALLLTVNSPVLFNQTTTLGNNLTVLTGAGNVTFTDNVNDDGAGGTPSNLTIFSSGTTTFASAVGTTNALTSVTTDAGGKTEINGGAVRTTGDQTYGDDVLLGANTTLTTTTSLGDVVFNGKVDSQGGATKSLTVNTELGGETIFNQAVGATDALLSLTTDAKGTTRINGGSVTTTDDQTYNDAVRVGANATLTTKLATGDVTFNSTIDSADLTNKSLTVNTTLGGTTTFNGAVGADDKLLSLQTDAAGKTRINAGSISTVTFQKYLDPVIIAAGTHKLLADETNTAALIAFGGTIDGEIDGVGDLQIVNANKSDFSKAIGSIADLNTFKATSNTIDFADDAFIEVRSGADQSVHIIANGALTLGKNFSISAAKTADYEAVANTFVYLPDPNKSGTALVDLKALPPEVSTEFVDATLTYDTKFTMKIGQPGEKGLQIFVDWGDTIVDFENRFEGPGGAGGFGKGFDPSGMNQLERIDGGSDITLAHSYTIEDVQAQLQVDPTFDVKFSISQHPSIVVQAKQATQDGKTQGNLADPLTTFTTTFLSTDPNDTLPSDPIDGGVIPVLINGQIDVRVVEASLPPVIERPEPPQVQAFASPEPAPPPPTIVPVNVQKREDIVPAEAVTVRKQVFVLRALSPDPNEKEPLAEQILDDDVFQADRLRRLFQALPDGAYDIVLRLGENNERPIIRFDIRMGLPVVPEDTNEGGQLQLQEIQNAVEDARDSVSAEEAATEGVASAKAADPENAQSGEEQRNTGSSDAAVSSSDQLVDPSQGRQRDETEPPLRWSLRRRLIEADNPLTLARRLARRVQS